MSKTKQIFVSPSKDWGWNVKKPGADRASAHTENKKDAITIAQKIAKNQGLETKIQWLDWKIQWGNSYWKDPYPPKG